MKVSFPLQNKILFIRGERTDTSCETSIHPRPTTPLRQSEVMTEDFEPFEDLREVQKSRNRWTFQGIVLEWKIPRPSSGLICCLLALCMLLQIITAIIMVIVASSSHAVDQSQQSMEGRIQNLSMGVHSTSEQLSKSDSRLMEVLKSIEDSLKVIRGNLADSDMKAKVDHIQASVDRILSDEVTGSFSSDIQRVLIAIGKLREEAPRGNGTGDQLCDVGWIHYGLSCYFMSTFMRTWNNAKKDCEDQKAHLMVINGYEEQRFALKFTMGKTSWIGLTEEDGEWKWVDGTPYDATPKFWMQNQPDDWFGHGRGGGEDCGQLNGSYGWNDDHCTRRFPYICEKKS